MLNGNHVYNEISLWFLPFGQPVLPQLAMLVCALAPEALLLIVVYIKPR